jgi:hypothetical protein
MGKIFVNIHDFQISWNRLVSALPQKRNILPLFVIVSPKMDMSLNVRNAARVECVSLSVLYVIFQNRRPEAGGIENSVK